MIDIKAIERVRYLTQKVLPTVYDDSLSYYELLAKICENLGLLSNNDVIISNEFKELYNYVDNYFKNLNVQDEINNKLDEMLTEGQLNVNLYNFWHNKKVVVYGDSLSTLDTNYWDKLKEIDSTIQITNRAIGGTCFSNSSYSNQTEENKTNSGTTRIGIAQDLSNFDIIVLAYGTNDWTTCCPLNIDNGKTNNDILGNFQNTIKNIFTKAPNAKIVWVMPMFQVIQHQQNAYHINRNFQGYSLLDYINYIGMLCNQYGVNVIDFYSQSGINEFNYTQWLTPTDTTYVHYKPATATLLADIVYKCNFMTNYNYKFITDSLLSLSDFPNVNFNGSTFADNPLNQNKGIYLKIPAGGSITTNKTFTLIEGDKLIIRGYTTGRVIFNFKNNNESNLMSVGYKGSFDVNFIVAENDIKPLTIENRNDFDIYVLGLKLDGDIAVNTYDMPISIRFNTTNFTYDENTIPSYRVQQSGIEFMNLNLTVNLQIGTMIDVLQIPNWKLKNTVYITAFKNDTTPFMVRITPDGMLSFRTTFNKGDTIKTPNVVIPCSPYERL